MRSRLRSLFVVSAALASALCSQGAPAQVEGEEEETEDRALGPVVGAVDAPESGLEGGSVGYEVALAAPTTLMRGRIELFYGVAYEVAGLDDLRRTRGLSVEVSLIARTPRPLDEVAAPAGEAPRAMPFRLVQRASATSGAGGVFSVALSVPDEPLDEAMLVLRVGRPGQPARRWVDSVAIRTDLAVDLLTDRVLYEAGETLHAWTRLREGESHRPIAHRALVLQLSDGAGNVLSETPVTTGESGAVSADLPLALTLGAGAVTIALLDGRAVLTSRSVSIGARHLERMRIATGLDRALLAPGDLLTGMVQVIGADSTPIEGAEVVLQAGSTAALVTMFTDAQGQVHFSLPTASYLSGDSQTDALGVSVSHPAHGSANGSESFTLSRTPFFVAVMPEGGALPLEVEADLYVQVENARGEAAPAGLSVAVAGASVVSGGRATTDAHGLARVRLRVPRTAVAVSDGGACSGQSSTEVVVTVQRPDGRTPRETRLCVPVAPDVLVLPHVDRVVAAPGQRIDVSLLRSGPRRPALVTLSQDGRARAYAFVDANETHAAFDLPAHAQGLWTVTADPLLDDGARAPIDAWGATFAGTGGSTSFVVRPDDAFSLTLTTDAPRYPVRGTVHATLSTTVAPAERAWATFLMRDESWHAGEMDYALYSWTADLREAIERPTPENELSLRYAFAAGLSPAYVVRGQTPVVVEPWNADAVYALTPQPLLQRDPVNERELLRRSAYGEYATTLETFLSHLPEYDAEAVASVLTTTRGRTTFAEDAFAQLEQLGLTEGPPVGLGGLPITPAGLERANIGFSFEIAAARVARLRLVTLLGVLATVSGTTDVAITRLFAVEPPERWLALAAHYGFVDANLIIDPWGRPFVFRDAGSRGPALVISERAPNWELVSAGADGRYGTADDVRDPFARVVPAGTIYAQRSGENDLIAALSTIAPGADALARMAAAYRELGLAAEDERVPSAVYAYASEAYDENEEGEIAGFIGDSYGYGGLGLAGVGAGGGGSGSGYGYGSGSFHSRSSSTPSIRMGSSTIFAASALARIVREDFPATLRFIGELPLDAQGHGTVEVVLADAVTTYRLEAIAWTETGWTSSALTRVSVDQTVQIDAPIPERAHVGDQILVPVRIVNRGATPMTVRPEITVEGDVTLALSALEAVVVPPADGVALTLTIDVGSVGTGSILIDAIGENGERLDAVRRPIEVRADARPLTLMSEALLENEGEVVLEVPSDALAGGRGEVRIWLARALFGELAASGDDAALLAWVAAVQRRPVDAAATRALVDRLPRTDDAPTTMTPGQIGTLVGGLYAGTEMDDASCGVLLRQLSAQLSAGAVSEPLGALLGLSAAIRNRSARPSLDALLDEVVDVLRELAAAEGARATEAPETWARVAAALALTGDPSDEARVDEMLRRVERHVIRLERRHASIAWLEPDEDDGASSEIRAMPTALLALALIGRGRARDAMPLLRGLAGMRSTAESWPSSHRALSMAAIGLLMQATGATTESLALTLDGVPLEANDDARSFVIPATALSSPGTHTLRARLPEGMLVFASLSSEHLVPWEREEPRTLPVSLSVSGEVGPRDTRAALVLEIQNRSARVLTSPVLDLQLPSGAELDPSARRLLERCGRVSITEDSVRIALPPLRVGGRMRIPLRLRSSLAGTLRGLGATLRDARGEDDRVAVLPSRALVLAESGPEPEFEEEVPSAVPDPVPLPRDPLPIALVESLRGL